MFDDTGQEPTPKRRTYYCAGCWRRFPEDAMGIVTERTGRGFRCPDCLIRLIQAEPGVPFLETWQVEEVERLGVRQ